MPKKHDDSADDVVYVLHRFPLETDTFIRDELSELLRLGLKVSVVSIRDSGLSGGRSAYLVDQWSAWTTTAFATKLDGLKAIATFVYLALTKLSFWRALGLLTKTRSSSRFALLKKPAYLLQACRVYGLLAKRRPSHLHNHFGDHSGTVTLLAAKLLDIPYSLSIHGPHLFFNASQQDLAVKVGNAAFVRCISQFCLSQLILYSGNRSANYNIVKCGISVGKFRAKFIPSTTSEENLIFVCCRLAVEKGIYDLIDAFTLILEQDESAILRVAGDGPHRDQLRSYAKQKQVSHRCEFIGSVSTETVAAQLAVSSVFALPSYAEGVPISLMEAMASGVPVVATSVGGVSELVIPNETGILIPPADPQALTDGILAVLNDRDLSHRLSCNAKAFVEQHHSIETNIPKLRSLLNQ
ncbi:MAG: glycosyltransferase [Pseudomonadota bacterium]